jgi:hypothetical protein
MELISSSCVDLREVRLRLRVRKIWQPNFYLLQLNSSLKYNQIPLWNTIKFLSELQSNSSLKYKPHVLTSLIVFMWISGMTNSNSRLPSGVLWPYDGQWEGRGRWRRYSSQHEGRVDEAPLILNFGSLCNWMVIFTPWPPYRRGNIMRYPLNRMGWPCRTYGRFGIERNVLLQPGVEPGILQPVSWPRYRLWYWQWLRECGNEGWVSRKCREGLDCFRIC